MSTAGSIAALTADGKLMKRLLVASEDFTLVGFSEPTWQGAL